MGKLRVLSGAEVVRILEGQGSAAVRRRGMPDHDELRTGTLAAIIRQSGLPRELFEHP